MKITKITKTVALALSYLMIWSTLANAQHPGPQPRPGPAVQTTSPDGITTYAVTPEGHFPSVDPFANPPGSNFLKTVYSNIFTDAGVEIPNTLPSTETVPYNLIDGPVTVTPIDPTSPRDDLIKYFKGIIKTAQTSGTVDQKTIQSAIDILEGNPIKQRPTFSGMALLHYTGPEKVKSVTPITDATGKVVGGNVAIHQAWYDNHIESDTALLDPTAVQEVPWTITYTIDVLHRGEDDFSPFTMYFSDPPANYKPGQFGMPHVAMDQTFFPMAEGTRVVMKIKMAPAKYYNLTYNWGWRMHPPRVQVTENALKTMGKNPDGTPKTLVQWETSTFGTAPRSSRAAQLAAIAQIGELAPAKRMWQDLTNAQTAATLTDVITLLKDAQLSLDDWSDRTHLPRGVQRDPNADATLFYVNNTIYGSGREDLPGAEFIKWTKRGTVYKTTLLNGDHFVHGYISVDFGGSRGWENQFQHSGGSGCGFTFGRVHWWMNAGGPFGAINVPPVAADGTPGLHKVEIKLNFEPSRRLRMYQFDPMHHDVAVYSLH